MQVVRTSFRRTLGGCAFGVVAVLLGTGLLAAHARAQQTSLESSSSSTSEAWADSAAELYRELFRLQVALSNTPEGRAREELRARREDLISRIAKFHQEGDEQELRERSLRWEGGWTGDTEEWVAGLRELGIDLDLDWEGLSSDIQEGLDELGVGLEELGRQLSNLELEVGPERIRLADRESGDDVTLIIPGEIREGIVQSLQVIRQELDVVLDDSTASFSWQGALRELGGIAEHSEHMERVQEELENARQRAVSRRSPRNVIAKTVVKVMDDFIVERRDLVQGDIIVVGGDLQVHGQVLGNVVVVFGETRLEESAEVQGDVVNVGGSLELVDNPELHGNIVDVSAARFGLGVSQWWRMPERGQVHWAFLLHLVWIGALFLLVLLTYAFLGDRMETVGAAIMEQPLRSLITGSMWLVVALLGFVVVGMVLAITIIGIPVVFVAALALLCLLLAAYFVACRALGGRILQLLGQSRPLPWVETITGILILELPALLALGLSAVWFLHDGVVMLRALSIGLKFLTLCIGVGAVAATRLGQSAPTPPAPSPEATALGGARVLP